MEVMVGAQDIQETVLLRLLQLAALGEAVAVEAEAVTVWVALVVLV
jgi:hypothetical protein